MNSDSMGSNTLEYLSPQEKSYYQSIRFQKRKLSYHLGRVAAKKTLQKMYPTIPSRDLSVLTHQKSHNKGAPYLWSSTLEAPISGHISISHTEDLAVCVAHPKENVGIDLESIRQRDSSFYRNNFNAFEQKQLLQMSDNETPPYATLLWTAKEALSKVLQKGLSLSTLDIEVIYPAQNFISWWEMTQKQVLYGFGSYKNHRFHFASYYITQPPLKSRCDISESNIDLSKFILTLAKSHHSAIPLNLTKEHTDGLI